MELELYYRLTFKIRLDELRHHCKRPVCFFISLLTPFAVSTLLTIVPMYVITVYYPEENQSNPMAQGKFCFLILTAVFLLNQYFIRFRCGIKVSDTGMSWFMNHFTGQRSWADIMFVERGHEGYAVFGKHFMNYRPPSMVLWIPLSAFAAPDSQQRFERILQSKFPFCNECTWSQHLDSHKN